MRLRVGAKAHVDARHDRDIEFNDWTDLVEGAEVSDVGLGLLDPWVQVHMCRAVDLVGDVLLCPNEPAAAEVTLVSIELPRRPLPHGQLRLELLP